MQFNEQFDRSSVSVQEPFQLCVLHSHRYGWAERAQSAGMPEQEAMAHLGHGSNAVHRAYARAAERVTMPLEWYEAQIGKKLVDFQTAHAHKEAAAA